MPKDSENENLIPLQIVHILDDRVNGLPSFKPEGLTYSHKAKRFFGVKNNEILAINSQQEHDSKRSTKNISRDLLDKSLIVHDDKYDRLLVLTAKQELIAIANNPDGSLNTVKRISFDLRKLVPKILDTTIDPQTGRLFLLHKNSISSILPDAKGSFNKSGIVQIALPPDITHPKRIAFDIYTDNLQILSFPQQQKLYELDQTGQLIAISDASQLGLKDPTSLVVAPLSDTNNQKSLFVADATLGVMAVASTTETTAPTSPTKAFLVRTIDTTVYSPNSSPDPSGITYLEKSNTLLICDGEVEEMPNIFAGSNTFEVKLDGTLVRGGSVLQYTDEPTGVGIDPTADNGKGRIFVSDDDARRIHIITSGADGIFGTGDDVAVGRIYTNTYSGDSEDVVYVNDGGINALFIAGGINGKIYRIDPGADGIFGDLPGPDGQYRKNFTDPSDDILSDDIISSFDTRIKDAQGNIIGGLIDVEGVAYNKYNGHLYALSGNPNGRLFEFTIGGQLVQEIDISAAGSLNAAGLVFAPGSKAPDAWNLYVVARGVDNNTDPNENDGRLYEFTLTNTPPTVDAGVNRTVAVNSVVLDATVTDNGAIASTTWTKLSGPGTVTFTNPNDIDTTATFSQPGTYILRQTASDGELTAQDEVIVNYNSTFYVSTVDSGTIDKSKSSTGAALKYGDEDILGYNASTGKWSMLFDASLVVTKDQSGNIINPGLGASGVDLDSFHIVRNADQTINSILFAIDYSSTVTSVTLPGGLVVTNTDIVRFTPASPTSWGSQTAGTYSLYFRGSNVGLDTSGENIDAFGILPDGRLLISVTGSPSVPGVNGTVVNGADEDLLVFTSTSLGSNTAGTWAQYFDGSDLGFNNKNDEDPNKPNAPYNGSDDVDATWVDNGGNLYLSTKGNYAATGTSGTITGNGNTIFTFIPNSTGLNTSGNLISFWDGTAAGLDATNSIDGFAIG